MAVRIDDAAEQAVADRQVQRAVLVAAPRVPGGTEFPSFIESLTDISRGETLLSPESVKALAKLKESVSVRVFVTPT